jgi:Cyclic nucleotide-binding domain.
LYCYSYKVIQLAEILQHPITWLFFYLDSLVNYFRIYFYSNCHLVLEDLIKHISKRVHLSIEEADLLLDFFSEATFQKKEFLLQKDQQCTDLFFVREGILRSFFLNESGKECTVMFAAKDWWITDMPCFLNRRPAMISIQAIKNSSVLTLNKNDLERIFDSVPSFNIFFRKLMENAYCREQLRMIENLSLPASERYENFLRKYPDVASKVSLKQIASYLGITPEFLSMLRSNRK